ncbi:hypothetical protein, partial [Methylomonas fluvii]
CLCHLTITPITAVPKALRHQSIEKTAIICRKRQKPNF